MKNGSTEVRKGVGSKKEGIEAINYEWEQKLSASY
jgi:hypothetical protein